MSDRQPPSIRYLVIRDLAEYLRLHVGMSQPESWTHAGEIVDRIGREWSALAGGDA